MSDLNPLAKPFHPLNKKAGHTLNPNAAPFVPSPKTADDVRSKVASGAPASADAVANFISQRVAELEKLELASYVGSANELIPVLAEDMKRKAVALGQPEKDFTAEATQQIKGNRTTALTTSDDHFTGITGGLKFDEFHELVHICSAQGGESAQHGFCLNFNEGAINLISELAAVKSGVTVTPRYIEQTNILKMLCAVDYEKAVAALYRSTFKGDMDKFFNVVGEACAGTDPWPSSKSKGFSEKSKTGPQLGAEIKKWAQNWSVKSISDRFKV